MLISNYSAIFNVLGRQFGGLTSPMVYNKPEVKRNFYTQNDNTNIEQIKRDSFPTGTNSPYSLIMGDKGGLLSATTMINGFSNLSYNLAMGKACSSDLTGNGTLSNGSLSLVTALASSLSGSGTITTAQLVGVVSLASSLAGTGSLNAGINVIAFMNSVLTGTSSINASLKEILSMSANIYVNQSEASVQEMVNGVWNALAADFNTSGTIGAAVNSAGTAGDPWTTILPGSYVSGSAGDIIGNLLSNIPDSVWNELKNTHTASSSYGKIVQDLESLSKQIKSLAAANL